MPRLLTLPSILLLFFTLSCGEPKIFVEANFAVTVESSISIYAKTQTEKEYVEIPPDEAGNYNLGGKYIPVAAFIGRNINSPADFLRGEISINQPCRANPAIINLAPADKESRPEEPRAGVMDSQRRFAVSLKGAAYGNVLCRCQSGSQISGSFQPVDSDPRFISDGLIELVYDGACVSSETPEGTAVKLVMEYKGEKSGEFKPLGNFDPICYAAY
ncbi:MAG: hypothetical protein Kow0090_02070 [Myxococcota bacterium]